MGYTNCRFVWERKINLDIDLHLSTLAVEMCEIFKGFFLQCFKVVQPCVCQKKQSKPLVVAAERMTFWNNPLMKNLARNGAYPKKVGSCDR